MYTVINACRVMAADTVLASAGLLTLWPPRRHSGARSTSDARAGQIINALIAAGRVQAAIDALDEVATALAAAGDELETAVGQLDAVGLDERAAGVGAVKDDVSDLAGSVSGLHDTAQELHQRIVELGGG